MVESTSHVASFRRKSVSLLDIGAPPDSPTLSQRRAIASVSVGLTTSVR